MRFETIEFMQWAKKYQVAEAVPYDLSNSCMEAPESNVLQLPAATPALCGNNVFGHPELRAALAAHYGVREPQLLLSAGSSMANFLVAAALVREGDGVVVERPCYEPLWRSYEALGARVRFLDRRYEQAYDLDPDELRSMLRPGDRVVVLTNLHNPSGAYLTDERIRELAAAAEKVGAMLHCDEVFLEGLDREVVPAATLAPNIISTNSLTKAYGLGGLRVGWAIGPEELMARAGKLYDYFSVNNSYPADMLALHLLQRLDTLRQWALRLLRATTPIVREWIASRDDLEWHAPPGGNLGFPKWLGGPDTSVLADHGRVKHEMIVAPGHFFDFPQHFRLSWGMQPDRLREALRRLGATLDECREAD